MFSGIAQIFKAGGIWKLSVLSRQFCCELKPVLKKKILKIFSRFLVLLIKRVVQIPYFPRFQIYSFFFFNLE